MNPLSSKAAAVPADRGRQVRDFAIADYRALLEELVALGYTDVGLDALDPSARHMFLRHDVDLCLDRAVRIGEAERDLGLSACFYVLVSARLYNPASPVSRRAMARLLELGHSIGLHFDATQYDGDAALLEEMAAEECGILERLTGAEIRSISFHRPAPELLGRAGTFAGRAHAYEPRFFGEIGYISDSSGGWYRGHPLDHPAVVAGTAIQLLTHPVWWHAEARTEPEAEIERLRAERAEAIAAVLADATAKAPRRVGPAR